MYSIEYRHIYVRHRRVGVLGPHHSIASPCLEGLWGSILSWRERFHTPLTKYVYNPVRDVRNWVDMHASTASSSNPVRDVRERSDTLPQHPALGCSWPAWAWKMKFSDNIKFMINKKQLLS